MIRAQAIALTALALFGRVPNKTLTPAAPASGKTAASPAPAKTAGTHGTTKLPPLPPPPPPHVWVRPTPPLPMLPSFARVRIEAARDHVVVVEDVNLPRGEWESGSLDLYVAFGAPGTPLAVDARLLPGAGAAAESHPDESGESLGVETAVRRTPGSQMLLGKAQMAGVVVHVKEAQLRREYALADAVVLRVRSLLPAPGVDADGARDVVVRLGASGNVPLTIDKIQVVSRETHPAIARAEASLCGPDASSWPLSVSLVTTAKGADAASRSSASIAPDMAVRHASDDLCIRWWNEM
jgi:hypothetical protein